MKIKAALRTPGVRDNCAPLRRSVECQRVVQRVLSIHTDNILG